MAPSREIEKLQRRWQENPLGLTFAPLAEAYRKEGMHADALALLEIGLSQHPTYVPAHIVRGRCYVDTRADTAAEQAFLKVIDLDAENVIALKGLADVAERSGRFQEAMSRLERLLAIDPGNDDAIGQLERLQASFGRPAPAAAPAPEPPPPPVTGSIFDAAPPRSPEPVTVELAPAAPIESAPAAPPTPVADPEPHYADLYGSPETSLPEVLEEEEVEEEPPRASIIEPREPVDVVRYDPVELSAVGHTEFQSLAHSDQLRPSEAQGGGSRLDYSKETAVHHPEEHRATEQITPHHHDEHHPDVATGSEPAEPASPAESALLAVAAEAAAVEPAADDLSDEAAADLARPETTDSPADVVAAATDGSVADVGHESIASIFAEPEPVASAPEVSSPPFVEAASDELAAEASVASIPAAASEPPGEPVAADDHVPEPIAAASAADSAPEPASAASVEEAAPAEPPVVATITEVTLSVTEVEVADADALDDELTSLDDLEAAPVDAAVDDAEAVAGVEADPELVVTETMAEIFLRQGHRELALAVYTQLAGREPDNPRIRAAIEQLEGEIRPAASGIPAYAAVLTGGQSVRAFFERLLSATRPAPVDLTRPERLSLGAVFGDDSAAAAAGAPAAEAGPSYDEFYADDAPSADVAAAPPDPDRTDPSDLESFTAWLKGLKR